MTIDIKTIIKESLHLMEIDKPVCLVEAKEGFFIRLNEDGTAGYIRALRCHQNLSNEEYHQDKNFISRSALMDFDKSAHTYWAKHLNPNRPKKDSTPSQIMGSAFHKMILELDTFKDEFIIAPEPVKLKNVGRARYEAYKENLEECENTSKTVVPWEMYLILRDMRDVLRKNVKAMQLLTSDRIENSFFWQDEHSGLLLKCRPDVLHPNVIVDLKTTSDASPRAFENEMIKYGYHIQMAMIRDGVEILENNRIGSFIDVVIETKYPYHTAIYMIDPDAVEVGHMKYKQLCLDLKNATENDNFPDYGVQTIGLPRWYI